MGLEAWQAQLKALGAKEFSIFRELYEIGKPSGMTNQLESILYFKDQKGVIAGGKENARHKVNLVQISEGRPEADIHMHQANRGWASLYVENNGDQAKRIRKKGVGVCNFSEETIREFSKEDPDLEEILREWGRNYQTACEFLTIINPYTIDITTCAANLDESFSGLESMIQVDPEKRNLDTIIAVPPGHMGLSGGEMYPSWHEKFLRGDKHQSYYSKFALQQVWKKQPDGKWKNYGTAMRKRLEGGAEEEKLEILQAGSMHRYLSYLAHSIVDPQNKEHLQKIIRVRPIVEKLLKDHNIDFQKQDWEQQASKVLKNEAAFYASNPNQEPQIEISDKTWKRYSPREPNWNFQVELEVKAAGMMGLMEEKFFLASMKKKSHLKKYCKSVASTWAALHSRETETYPYLYQEAWEKLLRVSPDVCKRSVWGIGKKCLEEAGTDPQTISSILGPEPENKKPFFSGENFTQEKVLKIFPKFLDGHNNLRQTLDYSEKKPSMLK